MTASSILALLLGVLPGASDDTAGMSTAPRSDGEQLMAVAGGGSWEKGLNSKVRIVNEAQSVDSIKVYEWVVIEVEFENGKVKKLHHGWKHYTTLKPGQSVTCTPAGNVKFVVDSWNFVCAAENDFGPSAVWGSGMGEVGQVWMRIEHQK